MKQYKKSRMTLASRPSTRGEPYDGTRVTLAILCSGQGAQHGSMLDVLAKASDAQPVLSAAGAFEHARIYPIQFTGPGRPVPGGGAISFVSQLSAQDFGASAARILPSGVIKAP